MTMTLSSRVSTTAKPPTPAWSSPKATASPVRVHRGQLVIDDGVGRTRRTRSYAKSDRTLERVVVLSADGVVTLEAAGWCADRGVTVVAASRDHNGFGVRMLAGSPLAADPRLSRALVLAGPGGPWEPAGVEITRALLNVKMQGQAHVARDYLGDRDAAGSIDLALVDLDRAASIDQARSIEGSAASFYWDSWRGRVVPVWKAGGSSVPVTWRQPFTKRNTPLLAGTHQHAADPVNALLNYAYSIAETVAVLACWKSRLDPALGLSHVPDTGRYGLALDLLETIRPEADMLVLRLLGGLRGEWFTEVTTGPYAGSCRLVAPLTHTIAERMGEWSERAESYAGRIASALMTCAAVNPIGSVAPARPERASAAYRPVTITLDTAPRSGKLPEQTADLVPDDLWAQLRPLIPEHAKTRGRGRPPVDPRSIVAGLVWSQILGHPWDSVRAGAGLSDRTVRTHLIAWKADGTWDRVRPVLEAHAAAGVRA
jgi:CRISPR/Cas system-associated endonuclease Cas1/transposase